MVLLVWFYHYRLNVAEERLQAATVELVSLTSEIERYTAEQEQLSAISAKAASDKSKSEDKTNAARTEAASVGNTVVNPSEYSLLHKRADEVRTAALKSSSGEGNSSHSTSPKK